MKKLSIPLKDIDERTIYCECADDFRDKTALGYLDEAASCSKSYERYVPRDIGNFPKCSIKEGDDRKIIKVFTDKFSKRGSIGRKYYDAIMMNASGRCPICGCGKLKNLDHFLPKSLYPLLCVTPVNLVPVCRDCNFEKNDYFDTDYYSIPFNPYFDAMIDAWLECVINFFDDNSYEIYYKNGYDRTNHENIWRKYEIHLRVFDLNATFCARASEEIDNCKYYYMQLLSACGKESVKNALQEKRISCEKNDLNSWNAALYRKLEKNAYDYCEWLEKDCT